MVLGLAALVYQGITYTTRETVVAIGPIHAIAERRETVPIPPIFGIAAVAGGAALLFVGAAPVASEWVPSRSRHRELSREPEPDVRCRAEGDLKQRHVAWPCRSSA